MSSKLSSLKGNIGFQVMIAMVLGTAVGAFMGQDAAMFAILGDIFINAVKMLVVPIVALSIIAGAANLGSTPSAGKISIGTFGFFLGTSTLAVLFSIALCDIFQPGIGLDLTGVKGMFSNEYADKGGVPGVAATIVGMIPTNIFQSLTSSNIIQILVFCLFFGVALSKVDQQRAKPLLDGLNTLIDALVWMINKVMCIAPIGVFGLMANAIGNFGFDLLENVMLLFAVYAGAIIIYGLVFFPILVHFFSNISGKEFLNVMKKPQAVALSTSSSMATLPVTMETCENELKVSKATSSFVLPLGATINMSGTAIYYGCVAVFFAQVFGVDLDASAYMAIILASTLGAIGQAGVPGPTFLVVAVLMSSGIPIEGLPLLFALDRLFDMLRTALNITGDAACAVIMEKYHPKCAKEYADKSVQLNT